MKIEESQLKIIDEELLSVLKGEEIFHGRLVLSSKLKEKVRKFLEKKGYKIKESSKIFTLSELLDYANKNLRSIYEDLRSRYGDKINKLGILDIDPILMIYNSISEGLLNYACIRMGNSEFLVFWWAE